MLAFIDKIVIPFLNNLYGAVGYLGVMVAMAIESAMIPLPVRADPAVRRLPRLRHRASSSRSPASRGTSGSWSIVATIGNTLGSLIAYAIGAYGGRPFLERYGKYLLIRPHEIELADRVLRAARRGDGVHRPAAADRPDVHQLPGRRGADADPDVHRLLDRGRVPLVGLLVYAGTVLGANWRQIRAGAPAVRPARSRWSWSSAVVLFVWWRLGMPGRPAARAEDRRRAADRLTPARRVSAAPRAAGRCGTRGTSAGRTRS